MVCGNPTLRNYNADCRKDTVGHTLTRKFKRHHKPMHSIFAKTVRSVA